MSTAKEKSIIKQYKLLSNLQIRNPIILNEHHVYLGRFLNQLSKLEGEMSKYYYMKLLQLLKNRPFLILIFETPFNIKHLFEHFSCKSITQILKSIPSNIHIVTDYVNEYLINNIEYPELSLDLIKILLEVEDKNNKTYLYQELYCQDISKRIDGVELYKFFLEYERKLSDEKRWSPHDDEFESEIEIAICNGRIKNVECLVGAGAKLLTIREFLECVSNFESNILKSSFNAYMNVCFIRFKYNFQEFKNVLKIYQYMNCNILDKYLKAFDDIDIMKKFILNTNFTQIKNEILFKENKFGDTVTYYLYRIKDGESENNVYNEMIKDNSFVLDLLGLNSIDKMSYLEDFVKYEN